MTDMLAVERHATVSQNATFAEVLFQDGGVNEFVKQYRDGLPGLADAEVAGLQWLAEPDVIPVVSVLDHSADRVALEQLIEAPATPAAAEEFGTRLARLHNTAAPSFGYCPSTHAWFGPQDAPFQVPTTERDEFTSFWVTDRLFPIAELARPGLSATQARLVDEAIDAVSTGIFNGIAGGGAEHACRVHGDLWSGNVLWTAQGATLIDPAAHGGHRLEDLALLTLFGAPHLDEIFAGYTAEHPLPGTWQEDLPAHLFFALIAHVYLFGSGFARQTETTARQIILRAEQLGSA